MACTRTRRPDHLRRTELRQPRGRRRADPARSHRADPDLGVFALTQIADELDLEQSTVNRQVHAALDSGALVRFRREGSATYLVDIADEGRERFRADLAQQLTVHEQALAAIPADARADFLEHLTTFVDALGEASTRVD